MNTTFDDLGNNLNIIFEANRRAYDAGYKQGYQDGRKDAYEERITEQEIEYDKTKETKPKKNERPNVAG